MQQEERYNGENENWLQFNKRIVIRREDNGEPYLIRRTLISFGKWFSIKYHQILQSDDVCSHDHPWSFLTIILKGGYYEWTPVDQKENGEILANHVAPDEVIEVKRWHGAGSIMYRPAKWRHRLELRKEGLYEVVKNNGNVSVTISQSPPVIPAHTLVFTFKVIQPWGFFTKRGWMYWKNYNQNRDC
jgi:hypothetical protein